MNTNGFYNGWSPVQRNGTNAAIRAAIARGDLTVPDKCSVCQRVPNRPLQWHSERYDVLDAYPICRSCHIRVHARFRHPDSWRAFIKSLDPAGWVQSLTVDPRSLTHPFAETYPGDLLSRFEPRE
jgi:hypothetical protein